MNPIVWVNRKAARWWPLAVSVMAGIVAGAVIFILWTVVDERRYFEAEQARDRRQDTQVQELLEQTGELIERQREADAGREERLGEAVAAVEALLRDQFAVHDQNVAEKLNVLLSRIADLLDRPAGEPLDPVAGYDVQGSSTPPPRSPQETADPAPAPTTTAPPSTTTTTSPGQSGLCERNPTIPLCRRPR